MVYRKLPDRIADPAPLLSVMETCRRAMTKASGDVRPFGVMHHGLSMVVVAIDALAKLLNGQEYYFHDKAHTTYPDKDTGPPAE